MGAVQLTAFSLFLVSVLTTRWIMYRITTRLQEEHQEEYLVYELSSGFHVLRLVRFLAEGRHRGLGDRFIERNVDYFLAGLAPSAVSWLVLLLSFGS